MFPIKVVCHVNVVWLVICERYPLCHISPVVLTHVTRQRHLLSCHLPTSYVMLSVMSFINDIGHLICYSYHVMWGVTCQVACNLRDVLFEFISSHTTILDVIDVMK